jgi:hypothetical protein
MGKDEKIWNRIKENSKMEQERKKNVRKAFK